MDQNYNTYPEPAAPKKKKGVFYVLVVLACLALLAIGGILGGNNTVEVAGPETTVTAIETATAGAMEVTPLVCLDALDDADDFRDISVDLANLVAQHLEDEGNAWESTANGDYSAVSDYADKMYDFTDEINALTERVSTNTYGDTSDACRSMAG